MVPSAYHSNRKTPFLQIGGYMKKQYWIFSVIAVVLIVFGTYECFRAKAYKQSLNDSYNRAFFELSDYVDDIDTLLAKGMLSTSAGEMATLSQKLSIQSAAAKSCLAQLPTANTQLDKTGKFLSQVGDYTYTLSQSLIDKKTITEEEYENLNALSSYASGLNRSLSELGSKLFNGEYNLFRDDIISLEKTVYAESADELSAIEKEFGEYPSLIYDGPFSEHIESIEPKMLKNLRELSRNEAAMRLADFLEVKTENIKYTGETQNSLMNSYIFSCRTDSGKVTAGITKRGGHVVYLFCDKHIARETLSVNDAISRAMTFLKEHGYENMQSSYYEKSNGVATINFAYKQNEVICYSDLIKVKVALDDGEIVGMEANGYIMNHEMRQIRTPQLSKQEARNHVSKNFSIDSVNIALIPKDSKREVLCYEFKGTSGGRNFLIYINAETGHEEDIQLLIESPDGILTI